MRGAWWAGHPTAPTAAPPCPLDYAALLLHLKHFPLDLRVLACQMTFFQSNGRDGGISQSWCACPLQLALSPLCPPGTECCPVDWLEREGSCYWFSRSGKTWPEAEKYCQLENAHLVVVGSWEEQVRPRGLLWGADWSQETSPAPPLPPEIHPAPHGPCQHLDGPHRPKWALEMGGWDGL